MKVSNCNMQHSAQQLWQLSSGAYQTVGCPAANCPAIALLTLVELRGGMNAVPAAGVVSESTALATRTAGGASNAAIFIASVPHRSAGKGLHSATLLAQQLLQLSNTMTEHKNEGRSNARHNICGNLALEHHTKL